MLLLDNNMKLFTKIRLSRKVKNIAMEQKTATGINRSFIQFLLNNKQQDIAASVASRYYKTCAPLYTSIDWISREGASITPILWDKNKQEFIADSPVLEFLENANPYMSYDELIHAIISFYLLTGNAYVVASGNIDKSPTSLSIALPQNISTLIGVDGYVSQYSLSGKGAGQQHFDFVKQFINGRNRYVTKDKKHEIYHIKSFNPSGDDFGVLGLSQLNPIYYEIEQYLAASVHNLSLLKRGASLSGIFKHQDKLSDDAFLRLQDQINLYFSGEHNAGRPFLAEDGLDFSATSQTNKDMDFATLKQDVTEKIYNTLRIPLPLISANTMTMANMDAAKLDLYDNAVLPIIRRIYAELSSFLLPRFDNTEGQSFSYNEEEILALQPRLYANLEILKNLGSVTANEIRAKLRLDDLEGGDALYQPASNVPYATK